MAEFSNDFEFIIGDLDLFEGEYDEAVEHPVATSQSRSATVWGNEIFGEPLQHVFVAEYKNRPKEANAQSHLNSIWRNEHLREAYVQNPFLTESVYASRHVKKDLSTEEEALRLYNAFSEDVSCRTRPIN